MVVSMCLTVERQILAPLEFAILLMSIMLLRVLRWVCLTRVSVRRRFPASVIGVPLSVEDSAARLSYLC